MTTQSELLWVREPVTYFRFPGLCRNACLVHGVFTRQGGISPPPYDHLNISYMVGDSPGNVTSNLSKIKKALHASHLFFVDQVHGDGIFIIRKGLFRSLPAVPSADAVITDMPGLAVLVKLADCQGIIILDPKRRVLANIHCGWRGNVKNILGLVVDRMKREFGCIAADMIAAVGPSLGPCCAEFVSYREIFPGHFERFLSSENHFDLIAVSCWQLLEAGLKSENIECAGICTRCRTDLFYSYRGEGTTGRFGIAAMLR